MTCEHRDFVADVDVNRLTDVEDDPDAPMTGMSASIRIRCAYCALPMRFVGPMPVGDVPAGPAVSPMRDELRVPLTFDGAPEGFGSKYGFTMQFRPPGEGTN